MGMVMEEEFKRWKAALITEITQGKLRYRSQPCI
jgi:hypothetical protein